MKKLLIVVDMQNDFISGSLGTKEAQAIVPRVKEKIEEHYRKYNGDVIFTRDTHSDNYLETNEGKHLPVEHCIRGTWGWEIHDELKPSLHDHIIDKKSFGYNDWWHKIAYYDIYIDNDTDIELIGLCTDICLVSNALILKAEYPEANIIVDASCCAGTTVERHKAALEVMKSCQIEVVNE